VQRWTDKKFAALIMYFPE